MFRKLIQLDVNKNVWAITKTKEAVKNFEVK